MSRKILAASTRAHTRIPKQSTPFQLPSDDGTYAMKKVLIQNSEQLDLVRKEICVSSLFTHPNLLPLLNHAIIAIKVAVHLLSEKKKNDMAQLVNTMVSCCIAYKNLSDPLPSTSRHDAVSSTSMLSFDPPIGDFIRYR